MTRLMIFIVNKLPFLLNGFFFIIRIILQYLIRYRRSIITHNLTNSFPEKNQEEIHKIRNRSYHHFVTYLKETVQERYLNARKVEEMVAFVPFDNTILSHNSANILMASHYGNWELCFSQLPRYLQMPIIAFYKPLANKTFDKWMIDTRSRFGVVVYPAEQTARILAKYKHQKVGILFIGDQGPLNMNNVFVNTFLHQVTPWMKGGAIMSKKYNLNTLYLKIDPVPDSTTKYRVNILPLDNTTEDSIMQEYSHLLEEQIIQEPSYWLWSHKRWKRAHQIDQTSHDLTKNQK